MQARCFPVRTLLRSAAGRQRASNQLSVSELQKALRQMETKQSGSAPSKGMESLKKALELLQKEVDEKKQAAAATVYNHYIVHTTGPEKVGMLGQIAAAVTEAGLDILASRATLLGGDFSTMIHIRSTDVSAIDRMKENLRRLPDINVWVHDASPTSDDTYAVGPGRVARVLKMSGDNTTGILAGITKYLQKRGVVVMNMASEMAQGPLGGTPTFKVRMVLDVPGEINRADMVAGLNALGQIIGSKNMQVDSYLHCDEAE